MKRNEAEVERERVEYVYGLTGGELSDEPWSYCAYWYDGVPEYAESDFRDWTTRTYRTAVLPGYPWYPDKTVQDGGEVWTLVRDYRNSGEAECPGRQTPEMPLPCELCEAETGDHGYIYIGEGCEAVYRLEEPEEE
jgi:hypothetical protein